MLSKTHRVAIFLILVTILLVGFLYFISLETAIKEGFADTTDDTLAPSALEKSYTDLQARLKKVLGPYCDLTNYVHGQMKTMFMAAKPDLSGNSVPGDSESAAEARILQTYKDVYTCKDDLAGSRPSCAAIVAMQAKLKAAGFGNAAASLQVQNKDEFVPCSVYMSTPAWISDDDIESQAAALVSIPSDLSVRVTKELEWYGQVIKYINDGLEAGNTSPVETPSEPPPPTKDDKLVPGSAAAAAANPKVTKEGFLGAKCTPSQMQARRALLQKQRAEAKAKSDAAAAADASSCTIPPLSSEIARVNSMLSSPNLTKALASCDSLKAAMLKLQSDQAKLKAGTLYSWQQAPSKKTYKTYPTGDRTAGLLASLQQNR
jgi:hypothetical protein